MLVVISDLHFEEEKSRNIRGDGVHKAIEVPRNIPLKAFAKIFDRLAKQARRDNARRMDLVLSGDIFELHRTGLWLRENPYHVRPYVSADSVDVNLESKVLEILHAINAEDDSPCKVLAAFRRLNQEGGYLDENGEEQAFPVPVKIHYIPGNHDRLANSTPSIRRTVREFLGLAASDDAFPHQLIFPEERTLIRHGHEYDPLNFSRDYRDQETVPRQIPKEAYDGATIGDFITVDVASGISEWFRRVHRDEVILADPLLRRVYERILEFDDLRPLHAIPSFLLHMPDTGFTPDQIWHQAIKPVVQALLDDIFRDPFLNTWLDKSDKKGWLDLSDVTQVALGLRIWDWPVWDWNLVSLDLVGRLSEKLIEMAQGGSGPELMAAREEVVQDGEVLFVVGGHTHSPAVKLIGVQAAGEQYYVDTGTWRQQLPAAPDFRRFGRIKSLTYVVVYGPEEDFGRPAQAGKIASLDYWSGVTQRWAA